MIITHYHVQTTRTAYGRTSKPELCSHATSIKLAEMQMAQVVREFAEVGYICKAQKDGTVRVSSKNLPGVKVIVELIWQCACEECSPANLPAAAKNAVWGIRI